MADVQEAGPLLGHNFTDAVWRSIFGAEPGIVGDHNGSAYGITLPPASDSVEIGSASIESRSMVGGFGHAIPAATTQSLLIPASSNASIGRTDLITVRLDASTFSTEPGPVRLHRIPGVEGSATRPSYDDSPPGVEDMPLYAITRKQGQALTEATVVDLRVRTGPHILVPAGVSMPTSVPLGTRATRGGAVWRYDMVGSSPDWVEEYRDRVTLTGSSATDTFGEGFSRQSECRMDRTNKQRNLHYAVERTGDAFQLPADGEQILGFVHDEDKPAAATLAWTGQARTQAGGYAACGGIISRATRRIYLQWVSTTALLGPSGPDNTIAFDAVWNVT